MCWKSKSIKRTLGLLYCYRAIIIHCPFKIEIRIFATRKWRSELVTAHNERRNPSLLRVLIRIYGAKYMLYGFILSVNEIVLK